MQVLKQYYNTLCHSLPSNYMTSVNVLVGMNFCTSSFINKVKTCGSTLKANQLILDTLIKHLDCEERLLDFCDTIDAMVKDNEMRPNVESFRNGTFTYLCVYTN